MKMPNTILRLPTVPRIPTQLKALLLYGDTSKLFYHGIDYGILSNALTSMLSSYATLSSWKLEQPDLMLRSRRDVLQETFVTSISSRLLRLWLLLNYLHWQKLRIFALSKNLTRHQDQTASRPTSAATERLRCHLIYMDFYSKPS